MSDFETGEDQTEAEAVEFEIDDVGDLGSLFADEEVKGPDPDHWSDEARVDRGAYSEPPEPEEDGTVGEVKGPDPDHWPSAVTE